MCSFISSKSKSERKYLLTLFKLKKKKTNKVLSKREKHEAFGGLLPLNIFVVAFQLSPVGGGGGGAVEVVTIVVIVLVALSGVLTSRGSTGPCRAAPGELRTLEETQVRSTEDRNLSDPRNCHQ